MDPIVQFHGPLKSIPLLGLNKICRPLLNRSDFAIGSEVQIIPVSPIWAKNTIVFDFHVSIAERCQISKKGFISNPLIRADIRGLAVSVLAPCLRRTTLKKMDKSTNFPGWWLNVRILLYQKIIGKIEKEKRHFFADSPMKRRTQNSIK